MAQYKEGDVVSVRTKQGLVDVIIKSMRRVSKGRQAGEFEYELAPVEKTGKAYGFRAIGERLFGPPTKNYSAKAKANAVAAHSVTKSDIEQRRADRDDRRYDTVSAMDAQPGDVIYIKGPSYTWTGVVAAVNYKTGKIGIERDPSVVEKMKQRRDNIEYMNYVAQQWGGRQVGTRVQELRWIQPEAVTKLTRNGEVVWTAAQGKVGQTAPETEPTPPPVAPPLEEPMSAKIDDPIPEPASPPSTEPTGSSGDMRKVYGPPPGAKAKGSPARVHTRVKGQIYVPTKSPSRAQAGGKYGMSLKGNNLHVTGDDWTQDWEPYEESLQLSLGDLRKLIKEVFET